MNNMDLYEHILYRMLHLSNSEVIKDSKKSKPAPQWMLIFNHKRMHPGGKYTPI